MKFTWEEQDIRGGVRVATGEKTTPLLIGYDPQALTSGAMNGYDKNLVLVDLSDGCICVKGLGRAEMAAELNRGHYRPAALADGVAPK